MSELKEIAAAVGMIATVIVVVYVLKTVLDSSKFNGQIAGVQFSL